MYSFPQIMDFQNDSSVNMLLLYFLNILMVNKLPHYLHKVFFPIPHVVLSAIEIFRTGNHISATYLHLAPTDDPFL